MTIHPSWHQGRTHYHASGELYVGGVKSRLKLSSAPQHLAPSTTPTLQTTLTGTITSEPMQIPVPWVSDQTPPDVVVVDGPIPMATDQTPPDVVADDEQIPMATDPTPPATDPAPPVTEPVPAPVPDPPGISSRG